MPTKGRSGRPKAKPRGGSRKGCPNKRSLEALMMVDRVGLDPLEFLLRVAKNDWKGLGYKSGQRIVAYSMSGKPIFEDTIPIGWRVQAAGRALPAAYPMRKSVDKLGNDSDTPQLPDNPSTQVVENHWIVKQFVVPGETAATPTVPVENPSTEKEIKDVVSVCYDTPTVKKA